MSPGRDPGRDRRYRARLAAAQPHVDKVAREMGVDPDPVMYLDGPPVECGHPECRRDAVAAMWVHPGGDQREYRLSSCGKHQSAMADQAALISKRGLLGRQRRAEAQSDQAARDRDVPVVMMEYTNLDGLPVRCGYCPSDAVIIARLYAGTKREHHDASCPTHLSEAGLTLAKWKVANPTGVVIVPE